MKASLWAAVTLSLISQTSLAAAPTGKRLIQINESQRVWMSEDEIDVLSEDAHLAGKCGGFMDVTEHPRKKPSFVQQIVPFASREIRHVEQVEPLLRELSATTLGGNVQTLSGFRNRYYQSPTGVQAAEWIANQFRTYAGGRSDIAVELVTHAFRQPSVIARIQGKGPKANEIIVLGAHLDSVNMRSGGNMNDRVAPGADDNASGTATLIEAFRVLAQSGFRPDRTIEFMGYAGEERGLLGSQDIAQRYKRERKAVAAVMQFDMTMFPGKIREITMISDNVNAELTRFTTQLIDQYVRVPWKTGRCGYACSDHASWNEAGFPATFPFETAVESMNRNIHTERDTLAALDVDFGLHFAKIAVAFAVETSLE